MKWMRERKWYLKTMAVGFIGSFFLLFLFYRQAALCFLGAVLGSVCYVRYRIKVQKEQEKWQLGLSEVFSCCFYFTARQH